MTNNIFKQAAQKAKEEAIKAARQIGREPVEILKDTKTVVSGSGEAGRQEVSVMQQVMTGDGKVHDVSQSEELSIHASAKSRLQQIEAELRKLRQEREQRGIDYIKEQQTLMDQGKPPQGEAPQSVIAPGKPKHGPKSPGQRKQGTQEIGKQYKG